MKKVIKLCLAFLVMMSTCVSIYAQENTNEGNANSWRYEEGQIVEDSYGVMLLADPYHKDATKLGIDVSEHQGKIDWEKVKADGIDFAIIRCGYGMDSTSQDDEWFEYNAKECERVGMPYGVYLYSYATTTARAASEAQHVLRLIEGKNLSYPVYYDMEDASTIGSDLVAIAKTFCNAITDAGYPVGVYANLNWWTNYINDSCFNQWYRWVAQYNSSCHYTGEYAMWQYTSSGSVNGINGRVDMNFLIGNPSDHGTAKKEVVSQKEIQPVTCTEDGIIRITYSDNSYIDVPVYAKGHKYTSTKVEVTCLNNGYTKHVCEYCEDSYEDEVVYTSGHSYTEFVSNFDGTMSRECTVCDTVETVTDPNVSLRIYGSTRYETSFKIADELKETLGVDKFDCVILASGKNFADALAGSYLAAKKNAPILITDGKNIQDLEEYIYTNVKINGTVYLLGGTSAISNKVVEGLGSYSVVRLWGNNRYETNLRILEEAGVEDEEILIATGKNFADSLSASASKKPILLVDKQLTIDQKIYLDSLNGNDMVILGGESAVSETLEKELQRYGSVYRVGGSTRYETSVMIAEKFYNEVDCVVLAYAANFPDGLCGGALASAMNAPLILTKTDSEAQAMSYVKKYELTRGVVLGGPGLISDASMKFLFGIKDNSGIINK